MQYPAVAYTFLVRMLQGSKIGNATLCDLFVSENCVQTLWPGQF